MLRRPKPGEAIGPIEAKYDDPLFLKQYPVLHEYLTQTHWDDRSIRTTSTLLIFCDNGVLRICLNDRDNNRSCFFTAPDMEEAMLAVENALATGTVDWRQRSGSSNGQAKTPF